MYSMCYQKFCFITLVSGRGQGKDKPKPTISSVLCDSLEILDIYGMGSFYFGMGNTILGLSRELPKNSCKQLGTFVA